MASTDHQNKYCAGAKWFWGQSGGWSWRGSDQWGSSICYIICNKWITWGTFGAKFVKYIQIISICTDYRRSFFAKTNKKFKIRVEKKVWAQNNPTQENMNSSYLLLFRNGCFSIDSCRHIFSGSIATCHLNRKEGKILSTTIMYRLRKVLGTNNFFFWNCDSVPKWYYMYHQIYR